MISEKSKNISIMTVLINSFGYSKYNYILRVGDYVGAAFLTATL